MSRMFPASCKQKTIIKKSKIMYQFLKSAVAVAAIAGAAVFQPAAAAVSHSTPHSTLPFAKSFALSPAAFYVEVAQNEKEESVHFSIKNFSGTRLRCSLKGPDGS